MMTIEKYLNGIFGKRTTTKFQPDFWQQYLKIVREPWPLSTPIEAVPFVVLDTETTGLHTKKDCLLSVGAVRVHQWKIDISQRLEFRFRQTITTKADSAVIHELLPGTDAHERETEEGMAEIIRYLGRDVLVGHHIAFDKAMLENTLNPFIGQGKMHNITLDTADLGARVFPRHALGKAWSLDDLADQLDVPIHERHTAGGDALVTALVFIKLLSRLSDRSVFTLGELLRTGHKNWSF